MIKLLFAGDYCPGSRVADLIDKKQYREVFGDVKTIIEKSDYSVVNFECPVVINKADPIFKNGPNLKTNTNAVEALQYAGFKLATLANNHLYDYGKTGVEDTLNTCKEYGIDVVGGGVDLKDAQKIFYKQIKNKVFAFVNFCEHEFSIATKNSGGANPLNPTINYYQILEAKKNADYVIIITHGGHEHFQYPSIRMKQTFRFFVDVGADAVINHHQHCYSGYEIYKDKPIFYGLGNFSFDEEDQRDSIWNEGYMVELKFDENKITHKLTPYIQADKKPGVILMKDTTKFVENISRINNIIEDNKLLEILINDYYLKSGESTALVFEPFKNRIINGLRRRSLFPKLLSKSKWYQIRNMIECESHRDKIIGYLKNK